MHVTRLEEERKELEAEEAQLVVRRQVRKRVVRRLITERQRQLLSVFFGQWRSTVEKIIEKRQELMKWFRKLTEIKVKDVFKAWHAWMIKEQLERAKREKGEYEWMMGTLGEELNDAKSKEAKLEKELAFCTSEKSRLEKELEDTLAAIHAQKVPETMEVIAAMGQALAYIGTTAMANIEPIMLEILDSPDYQKICKVYWSQKEEDDTKEADTKKIQEEAKLREEREIKRKKREEREKKLCAKENKLSEKESEAAAEKAKTQGEEDYKAEVENSGGEKKFKREEMDEAGIRAAKRASDAVKKYYTDKQKARAKAVEDDLAEKIRLYKIEQAENEIKWHKWRRENDPDHTDEQVALAMKKLIEELPEDVVLQLWFKYHLRRSTRGGFAYRRKVYNYKDDLRDGVSYGVLMKRIAAHVIASSGEENMDEEIDPQLRIDTMMEQAGRLEPPATAFNTRGHILGNDTFLNAAFISRFMITHSGLKMEQREDSPIFQYIVAYEGLKASWEAARVTVQKLSTWETWVQVRDANTDEQLDEMLANIEKVAIDLSKLREDLRPLQAIAVRGQQAWWPLHNRMQQWSWKLFGVKVKQEEEAPPGVDIDPEQGHAPFKLKDIRFEEKFVQFTVLQKERIRELINYTNFFDAFKEEEVQKKIRIEELCKSEKRKMEEGEDQLTDDEVNAIRSGIVPITDDELETIHSGLEAAMRKNYFDISRIFKYYAAGGEGGAATDISMAEWWQLANDCQYPGGKDPMKIEKVEVERCFHETETPEEIAKAAEVAARKQKATEKAEAALGPDEAAELSSDSEDEKDKKKTEEEEYYEDEYDWDLGEGEREIGPEPFIEGIVRIAMYKFRKIEDKVGRLHKLIDDFIVPNACKSNTDTFRGELSLDEVQAVYKTLKPQIMKIFKFYARVHEPIPGAPPQEPSMDGPAYMKFCKDSRLVTRKGDLRHDFPELACRKVFNDTQAEEEEEGSIDAGGGSDEMIYMEYLEALGAISCFKFPNPYIPLQIKLDDMLKNIIFPAQEKFALKGLKKEGTMKKKK